MLRFIIGPALPSNAIRGFEMASSAVIEEISLDFLRDHQIKEFLYRREVCSVLSNSRLMLSLWRMNISRAMIKAHPVMGAECVASHMNPGRIAAAAREPADEYPQQHSTKM
jgi:hypothetical protein